MDSTQCSTDIINLVDVSLGDYKEMAMKKGRGHWGHAGRPGKRGGSLPSKGRLGASAKQSEILRTNMVWDDQVTNGEFARKEIESYMSEIPDAIADQSEMRELIVCENPEECYGWLEKIAPHEAAAIDPETELVIGTFDRESGTAIASLWISDDMGYSGRNFYHEYGHSLGNLITSDGWERAWGEWDYNQDEGFANAFAEFMVAKRSADPGEMDWFKEYRPITYDFFNGYFK